MKKWDLEADVVVVGSGGSAFMAAIAAHDSGARVLMIERSDKVGGTTAVSGGAMWMPMNKHMASIGVTDSREEALAYCKKLADGRAEDILVEKYVDTAHQVLEYIETRTPVRYAAMTMPDYHPEEPGAKCGGRTIEPMLFDMNQLGPWKEKVRPNAMPFMSAVTCEELWGKYKVNINPANLPIDLILERMDKGLSVQGNALIGGLLKASLDRGISILLKTRAMSRIRDDLRVDGVRAATADSELWIKASGGVILACGGFEWSEGLKKKYLPGVITHPNTPPFNEGDGIVMAAELGADLANMHEVWWMPSTSVPGEMYEGKPYSQLCIAERACPHTILVNCKGRRFVNEASNYNDLGKAFAHFNENGTGYRNLPAFAILDSQYRSKYSLQTVSPGDPDPEWFIKDDTLEGLAGKIGVDKEGLLETVARFNEFARTGKDLDFGRGDSAYDRYVGDVSARFPNLGTIEKAPFFAAPMHPGSLGTKGGPKTNENAQVLDVRGHVIDGLYAAGNAMAAVSGPSYFGGGTCIGLGVTFGYLAGIHAAEEAKRRV